MWKDRLHFTPHRPWEMAATCLAAVIVVITIGPMAPARGREETIPILNDSFGFKTPPNNVYCVLEESWLRCDMKQTTRPTRARPPGCSLEWGDAFVIEPDSQLGYRLCHGDTVADDALPALSYGSTWNQGGYSCKAEHTGLTCMNSIGDGFSLSRNNQKVF
jgi:hypothetical protein